MRTARLTLLVFVLSGVMFGGLQPRLTADEQALEKGETLKGEVVALWCCLIEGTTGRASTSGARNCLRLGSPVAIKVGPTLYVVANQDRDLRNRLASWIGQQVEARGMTGSQKGQKTITISSIDRIKPGR